MIPTRKAPLPPAVDTAPDAPPSSMGRRMSASAQSMMKTLGNRKKDISVPPPLPVSFLSSVLIVELINMHPFAAVNQGRRRASHPFCYITYDESGPTLAGHGITLAIESAEIAQEEL